MPPQAASTTAAGLAQTRALLLALQQAGPTAAAAGASGTAATARSLIAQLDALKPSGPVSRGAAWWHGAAGCRRCPACSPPPWAHG